MNDDRIEITETDGESVDDAYEESVGRVAKRSRVSSGGCVTAYPCYL